MTRSKKTKIPPAKPAKPRGAKSRSGYWLLQDAKARFSELVLKVHSNGLQHVTVHGLTILSRDTPEYVRAGVPVFNPWMDEIPA
jgi:hypothetical protein